MVAWPGITWRQIEREWTDSQFAMMVQRLEERMDREQEQMEQLRLGYRSGRSPEPRRELSPVESKATMMAMGVRANSYPNLKSRANAECGMRNSEN